MALRFCESDVLKAWRERRSQGSAGASSKADGAEAPSIRMKRFCEAMLRIPKPDDDWKRLVLRELCPFAARLMRRAREESLAALASCWMERRRQLVELHAPADLRLELQEDVAEKLEPYRPRMKPEAYAQTLDAQTVEKLTESLALPDFPL